MKFLYAFLFSSAYAISCHNNKPPKLTDDLKNNISAKIKKQITNPESYTVIEWSEPDTLYDIPDKNGEYKRMQTIYDSLDKITKRIVNEGIINDNLSNYAKYDSAMKEKREILERMHNWTINIPKEMVGWWVDHKFKATDSTGLPEILTYQVNFDFGMNIIRIEDVTSIMKD